MRMADSWRMTFDELMKEVFVGSTLVEIDDQHIVIEKDGVRYVFTYEIYDSGCSCTYASIDAKLLFDGERNPVITNITVDEDDGESRVLDDGTFVDPCEAHTTITFFGEDKAIAESTYVAGSGSGYNYGSYVKLVCKELNLCELMVCY